MPGPDVDGDGFKDMPANQGVRDEPDGLDGIGNHASVACASA